MQTTTLNPEAVVAHASRGHHPYSPSTLQAREASPCYKPSSGGTNKAAERGTAQHEAVETGDVGNLSDEEAAAVALAMDCLQEAERQLGPDCFTEREEFMPVDDQFHLVKTGTLVTDSLGLLVEATERWDGTTGGYADAAVVSLSKRKAHILDWKFGKFAVEPAKNNTQGIAYALGLWKRIKDRYGVELEEVTVSFISPHIEDRSDHTFNLKEDREWLLLRIVTIVAKAKLADYTLETGGWAGLKLAGLLNPTTSACLFCARLAECPAVAEKVLSVSQKYAPLEFPAGVDARALNLDQPADAGKLLALSGVIARWAKEVRGRITDFALRDENFKPDGYQLVVTYPRKQTKTAKEVFDTAVKLIQDAGLVPHGKTAEEILWSMVDVPLTPIEEFVSDSAPRGQKTAAVENFSSALEAAGVVEKSTVPVVSLRMKSKKNKE